MSNSNSNPVLRYALKGIIVLLSGVLIWTVVAPMQSKKETSRQTLLARAKMRTLLDLEERYFEVEKNYATEINKLVEFVVRQDAVQDSLFDPLKKAYALYQENGEEFRQMVLSNFVVQHLASLFENPVNQEKFVLEASIVNGKKRISIKPSQNPDDIEKIGAVIENEFSWTKKK